MPHFDRDAFELARRCLLEHRDDYAGAVKAFAWPKLAHFNWALDHFDRLALEGDRPALVISHGDGRLETSTFQELIDRSNRVANHLQDLGVQRGDRILVMLPNVTALWETMLGAFKLGAVVIPATPLLTALDVRDRLVRGGVKHVVTDADGVEKVGEWTAGVGLFVGDGLSPAGWMAYTGVDEGSKTFTPDGVTLADDLLLLYFTSGTTAQPKLVLHTHQSYPVGHLSTMFWLGVGPGDRHLNISSAGWAKHAWSNFFGPWNAGACVVATHHPRFDAKKILTLLAEAQVSTLCAPPTVWRLLIQEDLAAFPNGLRELVSAGEPLNPEVIDQVKAAWGLEIREGYGQTETTCQMGVTPGQEVRPGAMGRPLPGYHIVLLNAADEAGDEGEVAIALDPRPTALMAGYDGDAERTQAALGGRFYRTGDVAHRDADGYYWYVGRSDDVFKSSDYRISPFELESVLIEHPHVVEAAIVPSPDALRMNVPKAFVVLAPGVLPDRDAALAILRYAREQLAPYKRVRRVAFAELPKTMSGKIRRVDLRLWEAELRATGGRGSLEFFEEDFPELKT